MEYSFVDSSDANVEPHMAKLLGHAVDVAWRSNDRQEAVLIFDNRTAVKIKPAPGIPDFGISIMFGTAPAGKEFKELRDAADSCARKLVGCTFTGMDGNVLMFGDIGIQVEAGGICWVRSG